MHISSLSHWHELPHLVKAFPPLPTPSIAAVFPPVLSCSFNVCSLAHQEGEDALCKRYLACCPSKRLAVSAILSNDQFVSRSEAQPSLVTHPKSPRPGACAELRAASALALLPARVHAAHLPRGAPAPGGHAVPLSALGSCPAVPRRHLHSKRFMPVWTLTLVPSI